MRHVNGNSNDLHDHVNHLHAPCKWQLNDLHDHVMYYMDYPCKRSFYTQLKETVHVVYSFVEQRAQLARFAYTEDV